MERCSSTNTVPLLQGFAAGLCWHNSELASCASDDASPRCRRTAESSHEPTCHDRPQSRSFDAGLRRCGGLAASIGSAAHGPDDQQRPAVAREMAMQAVSCAGHFAAPKTASPPDGCDAPAHLYGALRRAVVLEMHHAGPLPECHHLQSLSAAQFEEHAHRRLCSRVRGHRMARGAHTIVGQDRDCALCQ